MRILFGYGTEGGKAASNYRRNWDLAFGNTVRPEDDDEDDFRCPCDICNGAWDEDGE